MTFLELVRRVRQETAVPGTSTTPTTVTGQTGELKRLVDWTALAYTEICAKWLDWKFLWAENTFTLVNGTSDYTPPATVALIQEESLYLNDEKLQYVDFNAYRKNRSGYDDQSGTPESFTYLPNGDVRFFPTPNAAGTVNYEYNRIATGLSVDADEPLIPERYQDAIWWKAVMHWAAFENAAFELQDAAAQYQMAMLRLEAHQLPAPRYAHGRSQGAEIVVTPE